MLLRGERHGLLVIDRALFVELKAKRFRAVMSGWIQHREGGIDQPQKIAEITKKLELAFSLRSLCSFVAKSFGCGCAANPDISQSLGSTRALACSRRRRMCLARLGLGSTHGLEQDALGYPLDKRTTVLLAGGRQ